MAVKKNPLIESFQQQLVDSGLTVAIGGVWNEQTRVAMNQFQTDNGLVNTLYPNAETMALLGVTPYAWAPIASGSGAPSEWVSAVSATASKQIAAQVAAQTQEAFKQTVGRGTTSGDTSRTGLPAPMVPASGGIPRTSTRPTGTTYTTPTPERPQGGSSGTPAALTPVPLIPVKGGMPVWGWVAISLGAAAVVGVGVFLVMRSRRHAEVARAA